MACTKYLTGCAAYSFGFQARRPWFGPMPPCIYCFAVHMRGYLDGETARHKMCPRTLWLCLSIVNYQAASHQTVILQESSSLVGCLLSYHVDRWLELNP